METKDTKDINQHKVIRIFVNTTNDYEIWDLDESFTNDVKQIMLDSSLIHANIVK